MPKSVFYPQQRIFYSLDPEIRRRHPLFSERGVALNMPAQPADRVHIGSSCSFTPHVQYAILDPYDTI